MPSRTRITVDHDEIRRWVQERGGHPAAVRRTRGNPGDPGILRIDFPAYTGAQSLEQISWEEFFLKFQEQNLAFLCQETTARGLRSNFNKLIKRPASVTQKPRAGGPARSAVRRGKPIRARASSQAQSERETAGGKTTGARKKTGRAKKAR